MRKPFQPNGVTYAFNANGASGLVGISADSPSNQLQFVNSGNTVVFFRVNSSAAANTTTAAVPSPGSPGYGCPLLPLTSLVYSSWQAGLYSNCVVSLITTAANVTAMIYITPGEGV